MKKKHAYKATVEKILKVEIDNTWMEERNQIRLTKNKISGLRVYMNLKEKRYIELPYQIHSHHLITSICLQDYGVHFLAPLYFLLESWKIITR